MERYARNGILTSAEQELLRNAKVCIIGCGGLGGYQIEMLTRIGIGELTVVDGDVFQESNLNRQLLCLEQTLGKSKAFTAGERIAAIDSDDLVNVVATFVTQDNAKDIVSGHDVVVDALDSNTVRQWVLAACKSLGIPFVYGAIAGWYGQVSTVLPGDTMIQTYLAQSAAKGIETEIGNPSFTPACIASYQAAEVIKVLTKKGTLLREQMLHIDLLNAETTVIMPDGGLK